MGAFETLTTWVSNSAKDIVNAGRGLVDDVNSWCSNLIADVGAGVSSAFNGDVVGINANKVPEMINAIEDYIQRVKTETDKLKEKAEASTVKAMQGEYAAATKKYVETSAEVCYRIITQLRYFQDKLVAVKEAYQAKDQNMASTINSTTSEMNSTWQEYNRQK